MQTSLNKYLNQKGDALVMALMVALGVGALSIVFLQRVKTQQRLSIKYQTDSEIDVATLDITSHLLNPKNCNATFTGKAVPATANDTTANQFGGTSFPAGTGIYSCTTGSCLTSTGRVVVKPILTNTDDVWASAHTGFPGAGSTASSKIRITGIKYWLNKDQTHHTGAAKGAPGIIRLQIKFQKR